MGSAGQGLSCRQRREPCASQRGALDLVLRAGAVAITELELLKRLAVYPHLSEPVSGPDFPDRRRFTGNIGEQLGTGSFASPE